MALQLLDKEENDFSEEFLTLMAIVGYCVYGSQLIMNRAARTCDLHRLKDSFFQEKKQAINNCAKGMDTIRQNLAVFDEWFDKVQRGRVDYFNYIHKNANDLVKLLLLYYSRVENHPERRDRIFSIIESIDMDDTADYTALFDYFNLSKRGK